MDNVSKEIRSRMMAANRRRDTKPEMIVRRSLHADGFRYRLDVRGLPGRPDIVLRRYGAAIFVHGCFWHRHRGCAQASVPKSNREFWGEKFKKNIERDQRAVRDLSALEWRVGIIWECALSKERSAGTMKKVTSWLRSEAQDNKILAFDQ
jgi:DNA mismatch endonuclease (patch repair protein)